MQRGKKSETRRGGDGVAKIRTPKSEIRKKAETGNPKETLNLKP